MTKFEEIWKKAAEEADLKYRTKGTLSWVVFLKEGLKSRIEPIIQQQALPVVPECVGYGIAWDEQSDKSIAEVMNDIFTTDDKDLKEAGLWVKNNPEKYIIARNIGYTVEKPQQKRYEVKLLSGESMYFNPIGNPKNIKDYRFSFGNYAGWKTKFTKSELSKIKDGMFLKRIPGGTPLDDLGKDKSYYVWIEDCNYWKNPFIELVPVEDGE